MGRERKKISTECKCDVESLRRAARNTKLLAVTSVGEGCADVTLLYFIPTEKEKETSQLTCKLLCLQRGGVFFVPLNKRNCEQKRSINVTIQGIGQLTNHLLKGSRK